MHRALIVCSCLLVAAGCAEKAAVEDSGEELAPTPGAPVILISIDTLRADHLSSYGYGRKTTEVMDMLADEGVRFERAYAHSNNTAPSHMTMLTGALPPTHLVTHGGGNSLAPGAPFLASSFKEAGYRTAAFADGVYVTPKYGFARDFDTFHSEYEWFPTKLEKVESWLDEVPDDEPAFLFVHTYATHAPYLPPAEFDLWTDPEYDGPIRRAMESLRHRVANGAHQGDDQVAAMESLQRRFWKGREEGTLGEEDIRYLVDLYDGCVRGVDANVARLLIALDKKGWLDTAWVVVTSDHGEAFGEHGSFEHRKLYQEEMHVPLIIRPPGGLSEPIVVEDVRGIVDLPRTLLWAIGVEPPPLMGGRSLLPVEDHTGDRTVHATAGEAPDFRALVAGQWKLLASGEQPFELFDLGRDPLEQMSLLDDAAFDERTQRLLAILRQLDEGAAELGEVMGDPERAEDFTAEEASQINFLGY